MGKVVSNNTVFTPTTALHLAEWAIESASTVATGQLYPLITARVFTAFMIEGTTNQLGEVLCADWDTAPNASADEKKRALAWQKFPEGHRKVRSMLGLSNQSQDYEEIRKLLSGLIVFRDSFAHPKVLPVNSTIAIDEGMDWPPIPQADWEKDLDLAKTKTEYETACKYRRDLVLAAAELLENVGYQDAGLKFPHLRYGDIEPIAAKLKISIHSPFFNVRGPSD
jgi:hypothetical protein